MGQQYSKRAAKALAAIAALYFGGFAVSNPVQAQGFRQRYQQQERPSVYDLVVVGGAPGRIYLAALFGNVLFTPDPKWRVRTFLLPSPHQTCEPDAVSLSRYAAKALVRCAGNGARLWLDLTNGLHAVEPARHTHNDASQLYFLPSPAAAGQDAALEVWSESDTSTPQYRIAGAALAVQLRGPAPRLAFLRNGQPYVREADGAERSIPLDTAVPEPRGLDEDALLMGGESPQLPAFLIVDRPDHGLRAIAFPNAASWAAFPSRLASFFPRPGGPVRLGDFALDPRQHLPTAPRWFGVAYVHPFAPLYAPILSLAREEKVFPSTAAIWNQLPPCGAGCTKDTLLDAYYQSRPASDPTQGSAVYVNTVSYPGTWLHEFWLYYPFDVGGLSSHLHDSEHVFVEVDKLGGRPLAVLGAGHTFLTPNNNYSVVRRIGAAPIPLPIHAIVEYGKHATSPDINGDSHFTPGIDVNLNAERALVWGMRDAIGIGDAHFGVFEGSMAMPRRAEDRLIPATHATLYPKFQPVSSRRYSLAPFPAAMGPDQVPKHPPVQQEATEAYTVALLRTRGDFKDPRSIYKSWLFPAWGGRIGWMNTGAGRGVSITGTMSLFEPLGVGLKLPIPGRIALDLHYLNGAPGATFRDGRTVSHTAGAGFAYERLFTNLFGVYGGMAFRRNWVPGVGGHVSGGAWYRGGALIELPSPKGSFTIQIGPTSSSRLGPAASLEVRAGWFFWSQQNRHRFGRHHPRVWKSIREY